MNLSAQKGSGGNNNPASGDDLPRLELNTDNLAPSPWDILHPFCRNHNVCDLALHNTQPLCPDELFLHVVLVQVTVDLGPGTPYSGTLASVEHPKHDPCLVDNPTRHSIHRINLPDHCTLPNPPETWVARADADIRKRGCDQCGSSSGTSSSSAGFGASMTASNNDDIIWPTVHITGQYNDGDSG